MNLLKSLNNFHESFCSQPGLTIPEGQPCQGRVMFNEEGSSQSAVSGTREHFCVVPYSVYL